MAFNKTNLFNLREPKIINQILIVIFLIYFSSSVGLMNSTDGPQFAQIEALVEKRTLNLNDYSKYLWPDAVEYQGNLFTKRDPGFAFFNAPFYFLAKFFNIFLNPMLIPNQILENDELRLALITYSLSTSWTIIMLIYFFKILVLLKIRPGLRYLSVVGLGLGTLFWRNSYSFTRQSLTALICVYLFFLLLKNRKRGRGVLFILGLMSGLISFIDLTAVIIVFPFFCLLLKEKFEERRKNGSGLKVFSYYLLGFLGGIIWLFTYNYLCFGRVFKPPYLGDQWATDIKDLSGAFSADPLRVAPLLLFSWRRYPNPDTVSYFNNFPDLRWKWGVEWFLKRKFEGIFYLTPFLFFSLITFFGYQKLKKEWKEVFFGAITASVLWIIFISSYSGFFAANGFNTYYLLPIIPYFYILAVKGADYLLDQVKGKLRGFFWLGIILLTFISVINGWRNSLLNFAPHVTGDFKVTPLILEDFLKKGTGFSQVFRATFPNLLNLHIALAFLLFVRICIYYIYGKKSS